MRSRRGQGSRTQGTARLPGAGSVSPEPPTPEPAEPEPQAAPAEPVLSEPQPSDVIARFATAAGALVFAEQVMQALQSDFPDCYQAGGDGSWWVAARLALGAAREMAGLGAGRLYVRSADGLIQDRGFGDDPPPGPAAEVPGLATVELIDLVRVAGLHRVPDRPLAQACVLVPGYLVLGVLERAVDLRLRVSYQQARLDPLFDRAAPSRTCYGVWLAAGPKQQALPAALLSALRDDPFTLVCRSVEQALLVSYGTASPLSDRSLARMVAAADRGTWLLAGRPDGCARVTWAGEPVDAAGLVQLGAAHALTDLDGSQPYAEPADQASIPVPRRLTLVRTQRRAAPVDAVLLDDADLACLPLLLAGDPLADTALLIRGGDRHLLTAPGGLLTELPVGEPLTCVGPGSVYLPVSYRLDPPVGPSARAALFQPDERTAQVLLCDARLAFHLDATEPLWRLWAGPVPDLDLQLPRSALADLEQAAREIGDSARPAADRPKSLMDRLRPPPRPTEPTDPAAWRQLAHAAELAQDYVTAAQLYARNNDPLHAARMWEREAEKY